MTIATLFGGLDFAALVIVAGTLVYALHEKRVVKVDMGKFHATINEVKEATVHAAEEASEAKVAAAVTADTIGVKNGNGDLMTMVARSLGELAEIRGKQEAITAKLDERTHVVRDGASEPVELGPYMQSWFHELNTQLTIFVGLLHVLWTKLQDDYDLPDLPPIKEQAVD